MKMNFLLKSKPKKGNKLKILSVVILFCLLLFFSILFPNVLKSVIYGISKPVWSVGGAVTKSFETFGNYFVSKKQLSNQNLLLQDRTASLELKVIDYNALQKQNDELKSLLGRSGTSNKVLSRVLSNPPFSPYDTLVVDVGSSDGFVEGDKIYLSNNVIIGSITSITTNTSLVTLFSSSGQKQEVANLRTGAIFEMIGVGGANFRIEVPKDTDIIWGDVFEYPSLNSSIVGSVYYIDSNSQSSFKTVFLRIPGNVFENKWVFVEKSDNF